MEMIPLISCFCVTRNKPELLTRAIRCFEAQKYPNKELVVVYESDDPGTRQVLQGARNVNVRQVEIAATPKLTLGELRNIAVKNASGEYVCQWDDDDWYHERRLEVQMKCIQESCKPATVLLNWIVFNTITNQAYISPTRIWEGSILFKKNIISDQIRYENISKGEDSVLIQKLLAKNYVYPLWMPSLYIYVFHGKNTFGEDHFKKIFANSQRLSRSSSLVIKDILEGRCDNSKGSQHLSSKEILEEIDYFFSVKRMNMMGPD